MNKLLIESVRNSFISNFGVPPEIIVRSPGRINLLGEHTDYNDGFVLPAAIDKAIYLAMGRNEEPKCQVHSMDFDETVAIDLKDLQPVKPSHWSNYPSGVFKQFVEAGDPISSVNMTFSSDLPIGSGLSSSAALECGIGLAMNELFELDHSREDLAKFGQLAEHQYAGVMCGIMDQFASILGKKGHVIKLDCRSLEYSYHNFDLGSYELVLFNSNVHHELSSTAYNDRRNECEEGISILAQSKPDIMSLRDVSLEVLLANESLLKPIVFQRCKYVIEENLRVQQLVEALAKNDITKAGNIMSRTHIGLSEEYEVSCKEVDVLVDLVKTEKAVLGSRMMGGGFGGCTINIIDKSQTDRITETVDKAYLDATGIKMDMYRVALEDGTQPVITP